MFALWAIIIFIPTLLVVVIPIWLTNFIKEPAGTELFRKISAAWMRVFLTLSGCPLYIKGRKQFKKGETYIVICNHNSLMDVPVSTPFIPGPNKTIAKASMAKIPFFGIIYKRGSILVDRNSEESRKNSFNKMKEVLRQHIHMCIYPEGTRNKTAQPLKSFYDGAFKLATETKTPIIPAIIFNTKKVLPQDKSFYFMPHRLEMHFLPPVYISNDMKTAELRDLLFNMMTDYYTSHAR